MMLIKPLFFRECHEEDHIFRVLKRWIAVNVSALAMSSSSRFAEHFGELDDSLRPRKAVKFDAVIPISAKKRQSTDILAAKLRELIDLYDDLDRDTEQPAKLVRRQLSEYHKRQQFA